MKGEGGYVVMLGESFHDILLVFHVFTVLFVSRLEAVGRPQKGGLSNITNNKNIYQPAELWHFPLGSPLFPNHRISPLPQRHLLGKPLPLCPASAFLSFLLMSTPLCATGVSHPLSSIAQLRIVRREKCTGMTTHIICLLSVSILPTQEIAVLSYHL